MQQVHEIFVEEIHAGRWKVGTRLPGVINICNQTGLGNKTVQQAFSLLKEDGYIAQEPYKGSYLISLQPKNAGPVTSRVGILLTEEQAKIPYTLWISHLFMDAALRQGLLGEVKIVPARSDWNRILQPGRLFSPRVSSVISLTPFQLTERFDRKKDLLPVVFFCHMTEKCSPLIALDITDCYKELTLRAAQCGHSEILFLEDTLLGEQYIGRHREGYRAAMDASGLVRQEVTLNSYHLKDMKSLLKKLIKENKITALISGSLQLTEEALLPAIETLKISIPKQFSILTLGCTRLPWDETLRSTGIELDFEYMSQTCFDLLREIGRTGKCTPTRLLTKGVFFPGHTLLNLTVK